MFRTLVNIVPSLINIVLAFLLWKKEDTSGNTKPLNEVVPPPKANNKPTNAQAITIPSNLTAAPIVEHAAKDVGVFYNETTHKFMQVYGDVIQAFRTKNVGKLLDYEIASIGLQPGMYVCDAGCGVCGPATYFAQHARVKVEAITISTEQVQIAKDKIAAKGLQEAVNVQLGDYHKLPTYFPQESFDVVYFLESFGHSPNHTLAIQSAWEVLKPGGTLYIKDLFLKEALLPEHEAKIKREVKKINEGYKYNIANLYHILYTLRKMGFVLSFIKTIDLKLEDFENLDISNQFQELFNIAKIESWDDYIFPIDFFEIKCYKPVYNLQFGTDKYFLQNLYYMQVHNKKQNEL